MRRPLACVILGALGICSCLAMPTAADVIVTHPYAGVTHVYRTETMPRPVAMHIVEIDLDVPGLRFMVTPHSGALDTHKRTTLQYLTEQNARVAVNTHFFEPWPAPSPDPGTADLVGLAASNGSVYSPFEPHPAKSAIQPNAPALNIDAENRASIVHRNASDTTGFTVAEPVALYNVVSGNEQIITDGANTTPDDSWNRDTPRARTAIGLSQDSRTLFIFTVDNAGASQGMTPFEVAELLLAAPYSVFNALNLDGGGSCTLAMENPFSGRDSIVNVPEGPPRSVGASLAVFAADPVQPPIALERRVAAKADDAEESAGGVTSLTSSDLEMMIDAGTQRAVGMRFTNMTIPRGATIMRAYLQFVVDETRSENTTLTFRCEATDSSRAFAAAANNLSSRAVTASSTPWSLVPAWTTINGSQQSPDLAPIVQEVVGRPGWKSGNPLAVLITGSGHRTAKAFDGGAASAPLLHVEYVAGAAPPPAVNRAPQVSAGPDQTITLPADAILDGTATDDGLPSPPSLTRTWRKIAGPGTVAFSSPSSEDSRATFSLAGTYGIELAASDGALTVADTAQVIVNAAPLGSAILDRRVAGAADDAEESAGGSVSLTSTDLELMIDGSAQRTVGMRFTNLAISRGARVTRAHLLLQVDEIQSEATTLTFRAEANDNAPAFQATTRNLSNRVGTTGSAPWSVPAWSTVNAIQQTPDLSALIQEIVARAGWKSGSAIAILVTGSGHRTAKAFDGSAAGAPLLHVEFAPPADAIAPAAPEVRGQSIESAVPFVASMAPNPLRRRATLSFSNPRAGIVKIELFDTAGRRWRTLMNGPQPAGRNSVEFGRTAGGERLAAGIYFYRVQLDADAIGGRFVVLE
jgi:hypothetical protein